MKTQTNHKNVLIQLVKTVLMAFYHEQEKTVYHTVDYTKKQWITTTIKTSERIPT